MSTTKAVRYTLELKLPVLATDVEGEPNSAISHPFIPGSLLRGALVDLYLRQEGKETFDAVDDPKARALFLSEATLFLNAYPINENGQRGLPTPVAWRYDKEDHNTDESTYWKTYDLSRPRPSLDDIQEQAVSASFTWWNGGIADLFSPARQINVHTQRDARKGRSTGEASTIYRYDALAAGLRLQGLILTTEELAEEIESLLRDKTLWLGRARRAGYGEAVVTIPETLDRWRESETSDSPPALAAGDHLRVIFTSDALLRDDRGQATLDPCLSLARSIKVNPGSLTLLRDFSWVDTKIVGGFNRKWGLPLPQTVAIASGSIFVYQTSEPITAEQLRGLEWNGVGERRNEGFGRLLINWLQTEREDFSSRRIEFSPPKPEPKNLSPEENELAKTVARRLLRIQLDNRLREKVNHTKLVPPPNKNQLSRLRVILRAIQAGHEPGRADVARLKSYLDNLRDTARKQFERSRVVKKNTQHPLLEWLKSQIDQPGQEWTELEQITLKDDVNTVTVPVDAVMAQEYTLRLIDQVLYRAAKEQQ